MCVFVIFQIKFILKSSWLIITQKKKPTFVKYNIFRFSQSLGKETIILVKFNLPKRRARGPRRTVRTVSLKTRAYSKDFFQSLEPIFRAIVCKDWSNFITRKNDYRKNRTYLIVKSIHFSLYAQNLK